MDLSPKPSGPGPQLGRMLLCAVLVLPLMLGACSWVSTDSRPVPDSTFAQALVELHLSAARAEQHDSLPSALSDSVLRRYDIDPDDFDATLRYYTRHPDAFESLYDGVIDTLNAIENQIRQLRSQSHTTVPDSLRNQGR